MQGTKEITFGQFRLDVANERLWHGNKPIPLRPKAFAVLKLLLEHPHQLVNKQQVLDVVWPETFVGDAVLKDNIRQIREALGDDAESPIYIETAHRRGYRFIGTIAGSFDHSLAGRAHQGHRHTVLSAPNTVLGRQPELATLQALLQQSLAWERQTVFIAGEAGIGKTTLVQAFLEQASTGTEFAIAHGQCLEQYGSGEAYLPVLDGISRLCRSDKRERVLSILRQHAPMWLAQMPSLILQSENISHQSHGIGATRERMLREIAYAFEALTAEFPLLLVLEDIHWSDYSTLDLVSYLARRNDPARLMIIATYRPVDVILNDHPLKGVKRELQAHNLCREIALDCLPEKAIGEYLDGKLPGHRLPDQLKNAIYLRTEGNPLFMINMVDYLCEQGMIANTDGRWMLRVQMSEVERSVPANIRQLIEKQIERLNADEREVLDGASVGGMEFSTVAIAAGIERPVEWVESLCEGLARRHQFLSPAWILELPDGSITPRHRFIHVLYREVPYHLLSPTRRSQIHHRIATTGAAIYGSRSAEIAAELAMHFERSRDWEHALEHIIQAAGNATWKSAHYEAVELGRRGLAMQKFLPKSVHRDSQEITLRTILSAALMALKGFASAEVEQVYSDGKELFDQSTPSPQLFNVLYLLGLFLMVGGKLRAAFEIAERLLRLGLELNDPMLQMEAHRALGSTFLERGNSTEALNHFNIACQLHCDNRASPYQLTIGHDCKALSLCCAGAALWSLGYPDSALKKVQEGLAYARELSHAQSLAAADHYAAQLYELRGEPALAQGRAEEMIEVGMQYGFELWTAFGYIHLGCAQTRQGYLQSGIEQMKKGLSAYAATGGRIWLPYFQGLLAKALAESGRPSEGLALVEAAISTAESNDELFPIAELYRTKGELLLSSSRQEDAARSCFVTALAHARQTHSKAWELRTLISIHSHIPNDGTAGLDLAACCNWFSEGFETEDLRKADARLSIPSTE
jgi:DNA-binding winged helix-turn-helix (wHTH) protein/predicted ATPase